MKSEKVVFEGVTYRRYPEASKWADRWYYRPSATDRRRGRGLLHRDVWRHHHGDIPEGCHVHHKDGDPLNNDIRNLECVTTTEHAARHPMSEERRRQQREHADRIRPMAAEWHSTPEGIEWHRENGRRMMARREARSFICEYCGTAFESKRLGGARFCSNKCKAAWRRASGVDNEDRNCVICGATFSVNRYDSVKTCSRVCAGRAQSQTKRSKP